ncbi:hypothetical protein [Sphaerobacter thermophilus]|uniref:Uncharacterized protein n=1 Tax=Sphaerobacter thermophilus (strain ATCC 49802 / DSM 20745 / KCCM 41009 / NCIMB 13125 / S 6022) TaxID=479434 RepID=D1C6U9_SPHTD|nr:hypothetical protein [Sphaerobacter thermophilus]ACZ37710.1 hypothetical protein Sthe_0271 [Sphaerobacter thermophilus DSM 20745]
MAARLGQILGAAGYIAAFVFGYFVLGFPDGFTISRFDLQVQLFALGFLLALLVRSFWSVVLLPATVIFAVVLAGITDGLIRNVQQLVAAAFNAEVYLFGATALGTLVGTALPRIARRLWRALSEPELSELRPKEPPPDGHEPSDTP